MKRIGAILTTLALVLVLATGASFASTLELESSYPEDGTTGASIENMSVKLYFNGSMSEEKAGKLNDDDVFQLYDEDGKKVPTRTLYGSSEEGVVLVLLDTSKKVEAKSNSEYTLKISGDLVDDNGNQIGKATQITFKTLNEQVNTWVSMGMMVVMFGGMMFASMKGVTKAAEDMRQPKEDKVNPYKEAKKTGKSVEEIVEADQKKKAKEAAKAAKKAAKEAAEMEEIDNGNYKVHVKRSAGAAGSTYVAAKREAAAKAKAEAAKRKAAAKNAKKKKK